MCSNYRHFFQIPSVEPKSDSNYRSSITAGQIKPRDKESHSSAEERLHFKPSEQTANIQLFFDLFFVANLTSFTSKHEVYSTSELASYIGFFCILWFTWCQATLYDVRFSTNSIFEIIAYGCHFGVMAGLAVAGPQFNPEPFTPGSSKDNGFNTLEQLSLILMASRVTLFVQYSVTLLLVWKKYPEARHPLFGIIATLAIPALLYLGLALLFHFANLQDAYFAWYVIAVLEVGTNIVISGRWPVVGLNNTTLNERMNDLTLIIMGEGVIGLTTSIAKIEALDFNFSSGAIITIMSAVLIIYFTYLLYASDNIQPKFLNSISQQLWAFLHFPFHIALVLLMEGTNQFISRRHITEYLDRTFNPLFNPNEQNFISTWNATIDTVFSKFAVSDDIRSYVQSNLTLLTPSANVTNQQWDTAADDIFNALFKAVFDGYGFEVPETATTGSRSREDLIDAVYAVFELIFGYFFVCAGLVLISITVLSFLLLIRTQGRQSRVQYIGIVGNLALGIGLTLVATALLNGATSADYLGDSVWTLPILVLVLFIALLLNCSSKRLPCSRNKG